ncbi:MAG TPA: DUF4783 domain-containing protein [Thermoanaerobaculia bacterium]|jgi:hypothetical protein|nr:DUF4783 domain-containing protein [Thermoanaerobaculia bacterium]
MKLRMMLAAMTLIFVPLVAQAQFKDLDVAMSNLTRGFGSGDAQAIIAGIGEGDQVRLQFPGLIDQNGNYYGRDQAAYLLDGLFNHVKPSGFDIKRAAKKSAESQYEIAATWTVLVAGKPQARDLYITLRSNKDHWSLASVQSGSK